MTRAPSPPDCPTCDGTGQVELWESPGYFAGPEPSGKWRACEDCGGTGKGPEPEGEDEPDD